MAGDDAIEFPEGGGCGEFPREVGADVFHARDIRQGLPEEVTKVGGDAAAGCVVEKAGTVLG